MDLQIKIAGAEWISLVAVTSQNIRPSVQRGQAAVSGKDAIACRVASAHRLPGIESRIAEDCGANDWRLLG